MTNEQFIYWLKGFAEYCDKAPSEKGWKDIKEKLTLVGHTQGGFTYNGTTLPGSIVYTNLNNSL